MDLGRGLMRCFSHHIANIFQGILAAFAVLHALI